MRARLDRLDLLSPGEVPEKLLAFYHPETRSSICALRAYLMAREQDGRMDDLDRLIRMVVVNRLTGHSTGFSVYTLPPNQAVSVASQLKINARRRQTPPRRDLRAIVNRKSAMLLADVDEATRQMLADVGSRGRFHTGSYQPIRRTGSVQLVVTSPPFLDVVTTRPTIVGQCWFCGVDSSGVAIGVHTTVTRGDGSSRRAFRQIARLLSPGAYVAFARCETARSDSRTSSFPPVWPRIGAGCGAGE